MRGLIFVWMVSVVSACGDEAPDREVTGGFDAPDSTLPDTAVSPTDSASDTASDDPSDGRNFGGDVPLVIDWMVPVVSESGETLAMPEDMARGPDGSTVVAGALGLPRVARYSVTGELVFQRTWSEGFGVFRPLLVTVGLDGTIFVGSTFLADDNAPRDFDPGPGTDSHTSGGVEALFVTRFSPDGTYLGTWQSAGSGTVRLAALSAASDGALWLSGYLTGSPDLDPKISTHVLSGPPPEVPGGPRPQVPFLVRWQDGGAWSFGVIPDVRGIGLLAPADDGAMIVSGTFGGGGGATLDSVPSQDLDWGVGVDVPPVGCTIQPERDDCTPRGFWMRVGADGEIAWSQHFGEPTPDKRYEIPSAATGGALARPDGGGLVLGTYNANADFDWGPRVEARTAREHEDLTFDVFAAGFGPAGDFRGVSAGRTFRLIDGVADARLLWGGWSGVDQTWHVSGYTTGAIAFPADQIGGVGRPLEGVLAGVDENGHVRWATGLGVALPLGGAGAPIVKTAPVGPTVMLLEVSSGDDLDFTSGVHFAEHGGPWLVGFHEAACAAHETRPCKCTWDDRAEVTAACVEGRWEACACIDEPPDSDGSHPDPGPPDCGQCPVGWTCDPATWLCTSDARGALVEGLDHPTEVLDDGHDVYYVERGRYPRLNATEAVDVILWRVPRDGGTPEEIVRGRPGHLALDGGFVYWTDRGIHRTPSGGDGAVETLMSDPELSGPLAFDAQAIYAALPANHIVRRQRDDQSVTEAHAQTAGNIAALLADGTNLWVLADGFGDYGLGGLFKLPLASWGGPWERLAGGASPQGLADAGDAVVYSDRAGGGILRRVVKLTGLVDELAFPFTPDVGPPVVADGWVYVPRFGLTNASTWTAEVLRVSIANKVVEPVLASLVHAVALDVRDHRLVVVDHGTTRRTTDAGKILTFPITE